MLIIFSGLLVDCFQRRRKAKVKTANSLKATPCIKVIIHSGVCVQCLHILLSSRWCASNLKCVLRWQPLSLRPPQRRPRPLLLLQLLPLLGKAECLRALWPGNWPLRKGLTLHRSPVSAVSLQCWHRVCDKNRMLYKEFFWRMLSRRLSLWLRAGSGPDGRVTKKDIENFVPAKAAPVSEMFWVFFRWGGGVQGGVIWSITVRSHYPAAKWTSNINV